MEKKNEVHVKIQSILNEIPMPDRIEIIERIGKRLRQANSVQTAKEVDLWSRKMGAKKNIDHYPV